MFSFRILDTTHTAACLTILKSTFSTPWKEIEHVFQNKAHFIWGAYKDHELIAFIVMSIVANEAEILTCAVTQACQQQGVGHALLTYVCSELKQKKVDEVYLEVDITNEAAKRLYTKIGFHQVGERKAYYPQLDGSYTNALIMRLLLNN